MKPLSLTARISLLFAVVVVAVLLATGVLIARAVEHHFAQGDHQEMLGELESIRHLLAGVHGGTYPDSLSRDLDNALIGHQGMSVAVAGDHGRRWFATSGQVFPTHLLHMPSAPSGALEQWAANGTKYRGIAVPVRVDGVPYTVAISVDIERHDVFMVKFRDILAVAMALAALSTAALGWIAAHQGLAPLKSIARAATLISAEKLSERLPVAGAPDEIRALAEAFNAMLGRLEDAFRRLSDFSSDIAHELRTPVSNLMTQTQVALTRTRSAGEYREVLESDMEEYERLARMIGDMLLLAQADNHMVVPRRETVDMAEEVRRLFEFYEALAADRGVHLVLDGAAQISGDRLMLQRAVSNLLSNALRYTPAGGSVSVRLNRDRETCRIAVSNPGPTIPAEHLDRLFDRFYRVDTARRGGNGDHTGLGLAITKSLVEAHGGTIEAASGDGMTRFEIELPCRRAAAREED